MNGSRSPGSSSMRPLQAAERRDQSAGEAANLDPTKYAFVVLSNTPVLPSAFENSLEKYVRGGGSVLVVAGDGPPVPCYCSAS